MVNKGKKPAIKKDSSDIETKEAHHHMCLKIGVMALRDYKRLTRGLDQKYEEYSNHSVIATL